MKDAAFVFHLVVGSAAAVGDADPTNDGERVCRNLVARDAVLLFEEVIDIADLAVTLTLVVELASPSPAAPSRRTRQRSGERPTLVAGCRIREIDRREDLVGND